MVSICLQTFLTSFHEIGIHTQKLFFRTVLNFCSNVVFEFINSVRLVSIDSMSTHYIIQINKMMCMILLIKIYENLIHGLATCRWARTSYTYIPVAAWHKDVWNALYHASDMPVTLGLLTLEMSRARFSDPGQVIRTVLKIFLIYWRNCSDILNLSDSFLSTLPNSSFDGMLACLCS
jgi:hypothetical protein